MWRTNQASPYECESIHLCAKKLTFITFVVSDGWIPMEGFDYLAAKGYVDNVADKSSLPI